MVLNKGNESIWNTLLNFIFRNNNNGANPKPGRSVSFENNGRSGYVIYWDGEKTTRFYSEIGGGDCIFYVVIPSKEQWEQQTGYLEGERDEIIRFVSEETLRNQTSLPGSFFKIEDKHILFMQNGS